MNRYYSEVFGTFALVMAGTGAIVVNDVAGGSITHVGISLTFGLVVLAVVYAVGDISGAHINPAVTLGFWLAGRFPFARVGPYIASQLIGALAASFTLRMLFPNHETLGATLPAGAMLQSLILEIILTWFLVFVILCVSSGAKEKGIMAGVAVGATVALSAMYAGPICGASMNPARSIGPAVAALVFTHQWIYIVGPLVGAALAVICHRLVYAGSEDSPSEEQSS